MRIQIRQSHEAFIRKQLKSGRFRSADDVVAVALERLKNEALTSGFTFEPGELDALIAEGEASAKRGGWLDAGQVFTEVRKHAKRHARRKIA